MAMRSWMMMATVAVSGLVSIAITGCQTQRPTETIRASGEHRFKSGNYASARDEYAEITARFPGDWEAQYMLGQSMLMTGELSSARRALETAYTLKPEHPGIIAALAEAMFQQKDEARLFAFLRGRVAASQTVDSHLMLARYAAEMGDPDTAMTAVDTAIQLDDGRTAGPYLEAAQLAERLGQLDIAVYRLRQAYGVNPHDARIHERLRALGEEPGRVSPLPPGRERSAA